MQSQAVYFLEGITRLWITCGGKLPEVPAEFWYGGPREVAQVVRHLLCKHEDLTLTPAHRVWEKKLVTVAVTC